MSSTKDQEMAAGQRTVSKRKERYYLLEETITGLSFFKLKEVGTERKCNPKNITITIQRDFSIVQHVSNTSQNS